MQLRFDFPDYPASEQIRDIEKAKWQKRSDVYVSKVDGVWNAIVPRKHNIVINGKQGEELTEFVMNVKEELEEFGINPDFRCVRNHGIDDQMKYSKAVLAKINSYER
jgi:hypothetical protein